MKCEECSNSVDLVICADCDEVLCPVCDCAIHKGGNRKNHLRTRICSSCRAPATAKCSACDVYSCPLCQSTHKTHVTIPINLPKTLGVFFDISSFEAIPVVSIKELIQEVTYRIASPKFVKVYCDDWTRIDNTEGIEVVNRFGIAPVETLLLDLSVLLNSGLSHILIIVQNVSTIRPKLLLLQSTDVKISIAFSVLPFTFCQLEKGLELTRTRKRKGSFGENIEKKMFLLGSGDILDFMVEEARLGHVLIEKSSLSANFAARTKTTIEEGLMAVQCAQKKLLIRETMIKLGEFEVSFYSLKIQNLSKEVLCWVLRSLKNDGILPTEKNIRYRTRQAYGLEIPKKQWNLLASKGKPRRCSSVSKIIEKVDKTVFPFGPKWVGFDCIKSDIYNLKSTDCWDDFLLFLEKYFEKHYKVRIPIGRYGCALLVKYSGPESLQHLSLGKILYLINQAFTDDILRFHHRQLVWSKDFKNLNSQAYQKMEDVKKALFQIISSHPSGLSLTLLSTLFKKNTALTLNIKEFGYRKLKEFLSSISEFEINEKAEVQLKKKPVFDRDLLLEAISDIIKEKEFGISETILQTTLQARINNSIDWSVYNVSSCEEFIKKYSGSSIEILRTAECTILFRANELRSYSFFFPFKSSFNSAVLESSRVPTPQGYHAVSYSYDTEPRTPNAEPMQRIINISNIPSEMIQKSPSREFEFDDDQTTSLLFDEISNIPRMNSFCFRVNSVDPSPEDFQGRTGSLSSTHSLNHSHHNFSWTGLSPFSLNENLH